MVKLTERPEWSDLSHHAKKLKNKEKQHIVQENNTALFSLSIDALNATCLYHHATKETLSGLVQLAEASALSQKIEDLFQQKHVNVSEKLPASHTVLRDETASPEIQAMYERMRQISEKIAQHTWLGYTGKPIQNIVHIGIGGSDLSQRLTCQALHHYATSTIPIHFVANIDPDEMDDILKKCDPETTLVIMASKSFVTLETCINFDHAVQWLNDSRAIQTQVIAITAYPERAQQRYPIPSEHILTIPLGIGGRYSIWSAMGLALMITIGFDHFKSFLQGAHAMDKHFRYTSLQENIPVMLALMGIWNINFAHCQTHALIPYSQRLSYLPMYLQQLDMESNGKSTTAHNEAIDYATGPIVWGGIGSNSQHSFHQLLHQGTHAVSVDFLMVALEENKKNDQRRYWLNSNCSAQVQTLSKNPRCFVNLITLKELSPYTLGALLALYEHKIYAQSCIWEINPFDQPGVEEAKRVAQELFHQNILSPN